MYFVPNGRSDPGLYLDEIACNHLSVLGSKKVLEKTWVEVSSYLGLTYVYASQQYLGLLRVTKSFVF